MKMMKVAGQKNKAIEAKENLFPTSVKSLPALREPQAQPIKTRGMEKIKQQRAEAEGDEDDSQRMISPALPEVAVNERDQGAAEAAERAIKPGQPLQGTTKRQIPLGESYGLRRIMGEG